MMIGQISKEPHLLPEMIEFVEKSVSLVDLWSNTSFTINNSSNGYSQLKKDIKNNFTRENLEYFAKISQLQLPLQEPEIDKQVEPEESGRSLIVLDMMKDAFAFSNRITAQTLEVVKASTDTLKQFNERKYISIEKKLETMEHKKESIEEEMEERNPRSDVHSLSENSRKR